jgi:DsbC/DsbD-like thiol-disulfide interchange protein
MKLFSLVGASRMLTRPRGARTRACRVHTRVNASWIFAPLCLTAALVFPSNAADWTPPVEVRSQENLCLTYQARLDGPYLVIRAKIEPGWHTFAMDNKQRAEEKLAGKKALSVDKATEITLTGGLLPVAPWYQSPPKDFSRAQLRWFSWGFDRDALFVTKVKQSATAPTEITIRGQACTAEVCKNIDSTISLPATILATTPEVDLKALIPVPSAILTNE